MRLTVDDLGIWLPDSGTVIEHLDLAVAAGEAVLLVGPNGFGASTALGAVAGRRVPGERRIGRIGLEGRDATHADVDELARFVQRVDGSGLPAEVPVSELLRPPRASSNRTGVASQGRADQLIDLLGLGPVMERDAQHLSPSERTRVALARTVLRQPDVLVLDNILGSLESRWKPAACAVVRTAVDQGVGVLWADQDVATALPGVDRVVERTEAGTRVDSAWRWRPRELPWTPLQRLATALDATETDSHTIAGLRRFGPRLAEAAQHVSTPSPKRGSSVPIALAAELEVAVDDSDPPVILCMSDRDAARCVRAITRANDLPLPRRQAWVTWHRLARRSDRRLAKPAGTTLEKLRRSVPALRPNAATASHSSGEQAAAWNELTFAIPGLQVLHEPFRYLDRRRCEELARRLRDDWRTGTPRLVVTTDVDVTAWFQQVILWEGETTRSPSRVEALGDQLPALPQITQVCAPATTANIEGLIEQLRGASV